MLRTLRPRGSNPSMERENMEKAQHFPLTVHLSPGSLSTESLRLVCWTVYCEDLIAMVTQAAQHQEELLVPPVLQMSTQQIFV